MTTQKTPPTGNYLEARLVVSIYLVVSTKLVTVNLLKHIHAPQRTNVVKVTLALVLPLL